MTVELRPFGVRCNLQCQYCYQNPQRDADNVAREYDLAAMKAAIKAEGGPFSMFGGEPLLMPKADLEHLWEWGLAEFGRNGIQTNGTLIDEGHIALFKRYRVHVGISVDGPDALNDVRWHGDLKRTRRATARTHEAIERLCREGLAPSIIVTLHRGNAAPDRLPVLVDWVRSVAALGVTSMRLHLLESESPAVRLKYGLSAQENIAALLEFKEVQREIPSLHFDVFSDMERMLLGQDENTTCVWNACDPYTTRAVRGVEGHGQRSNCGRTNKDGIDFVKSAEPGFERYIALYSTPQEFGGCKGCRFFLMCKGQCPGTALDGDWRNRTEHCEVWKNLYEVMETQLLDAGRLPLSASPTRPEIERQMVHAWSTGHNTTVASLLRRETAAQPAWSRELQRIKEDLRELVPLLTSPRG